MTLALVDLVKMELVTHLMNVPTKVEPMLEVVLKDMEFVVHVRIYSNSLSCLFELEIYSIVTVGCGGRSNENFTYFESSGGEIGACQMTICRCNENVCQVINNIKSSSLNLCIIIYS